MSPYIIRNLTADDAQSAAKLWHLVFGDEEELVLAFFRLFSSEEGFGACAELEGQIVAAAYCPSGTDYIAPDGTARKGAYLYAVATHPDHRKHGLAKALCQQLRDHAFRRGAELMFTKPSEESLYPWYAEKVGAVPAMSGQVLEFERTDGNPLPVRHMTLAEHRRRRWALLQGLPHVCHDNRWVTWQALLHEAYGGGYYAVGDAVADVYCDGETVQVNELLPHPDAAAAEAAARSLMSTLGAQHCVCTVYGTGQYVSVCARDGVLPADGWFGCVYG